MGVWSPEITHTSEKSGYWGTQSREAGTTETIQSETTLGAWRLTLVYSRVVPAGVREDTMTNNLAIAKTIGGGQYGLGLTSELSAIETIVNAYATLIANKQNSGVTLSEYVWHELRASHPPADGGGEKVGPAIRRTPKSVVGANATSRTPDQISATITLQTASRKHWGRIYVPGLRLSAWDTTYGRLTTTVADDLATAMRGLVNDLNTAGYTVGVWSYKFQAFLPVYKVAVDDVVDIQRRRRAKQKSYQRVYTS